ncbi:MAG: flagellar motor protein MotB, partial [Treponema sp.]|nr:flagellar motor protein MotB [Treponema sp.]
MKKIKRFGNKRIYAICAAFFLASLGAFAERAPEYISPNNDGVKDTLEIPLKVKEKRFIKEWKLTIYNEERKPVRTIGNKRKDDEHLNVKGFFKKLVAPKTGIDVPSSVVWNGLLGEEAAALGLVPGEVAPDGIYYYTFSATDDNDNTGTSREYAVIVDCTPPTISFGKMTDDEKSFGEGEKTSLKILQNGSEETLWTGAIIYNADGKKVRTYRWENSRPAPEVIWDGTSDTGAVVPDGVYTYEIYATDRAGNTSEHALVNNIIFSATKPVINISLRGMRFFSPNGDGIFDTVDFDVHLPVQASKVNSLDSWKIS